MTTNPKTFALLDCNNFYVSCERIFAPHLENKPVVVLSNNDGCIIARSDEAKDLGIKMGIPAFEIQDLLEKHQVNIFSTNYTLYGDISERVMSVLSQFSPVMEIYSIDEAFLDLTGMPEKDIKQYSREIADTVIKWTGIPVTIGIAPTKTLAKIASLVAKKSKRHKGIVEINTGNDLDPILKDLAVHEVWGIGSQNTKLFQKNGISTAYDLKKANIKWVRKKMGVLGERLVLELNGTSCYPVDQNPAGKKGICSSRSYGKAMTEYEEIEQATMTYVAMVAEKLRKQNSIARVLTIFVMTNKFASGPKYVNGSVIQLPVATNDTAELIHHASLALKKLYRKGYLYKKSGVIATEIIPADALQCSLWDDLDREKQKKISTVIDKVNEKMGRGKIKYAIQGERRKWKMKQEKLSPRYTTEWGEMLRIDV